MASLEDWASMDDDHLISLLGAIEALRASTLRLPVVGEATANVQSFQDAVGSAVDIMQAMTSSLHSLLPMPTSDKERLESIEKTLGDLQLAMSDQEAFREEMKVAQADLKEQLQQLAAAVLARQDSGSSSRGPQFDAASAGFTSGAANGAPPHQFPPGFIAVKSRELPEFDGSDPLAWIAQAEQYLLVHKTLISDRVHLAMIAMSGRAIFWAQWAHRRSPSIGWEQFSRELIERFGDSSTKNAYEAMHATRQMGSLDDYLALFEERIAQLPNLPSDQYLGMFLGGLNPSVRDQISDAETGDVHSAIRAARRVSRSSDYSQPFSKPAFQHSYGRSPTSLKGGVSAGVVPTLGTNGSALQSSQQSSAASSRPQPHRKTRHLSAEEAREYREKGKCFRCSQPYGPLHRCDAKHLNVLIGPFEEDPE
ncbi:hypothetical protein OROHE_007267 [Orobanche hederae]